tara:strand:+ start:101 stop:535 length:435 start_codon:yes stop_codon:yes gene_type:complete
MKEVEVEIDDITTLANFIIENGKNRIVVESKDFRNSKDLFFFCVEITMKILSIKYGDENKKVNIDDLSIENINEVKEILLNAAIELTINITPINFPIEASHIEYILPSHDIKNITNDYSLEDYKMILKKNNNKYNISFKIKLLN